MGNSSSTIAVSKNFDPSQMPQVHPAWNARSTRCSRLSLSRARRRLGYADRGRKLQVFSDSGETLKPQDSVIFNVGVRELGGFGDNAVVSLTLQCEGWKDQVGQTTSVGMLEHKHVPCVQAMLLKGFTFALHRDSLQSATLTLRVIDGNKIACERAIPVRTIKYSGQKFFNEQIVFGALQGPDKHTRKICSVKLSFELISIGDGKIYLNSRSLGKFFDLELARPAGMQSHPLQMAMAQ